MERVVITERTLPQPGKVLAAAATGDGAGGIQDLEQLERRMLLQEIHELRQRSRKSLMEPITEESELAYRWVGTLGSPMLGREIRAVVRRYLDLCVANHRTNEPALIEDILKPVADDMYPIETGKVE